MVELGLGLLSIGRPWGHRREPPPPESQALALLEKAVTLGIRFFDTAPAYGTSEVILGRFLRRAEKAVIVSTKMGEWWDATSGISRVDHRYEPLQRSIDRSFELLGRVDVLQVHKASAENLSSRDVERAVDYARGLGVRHFGASVSDLDAARVATEAGWCSYIQFPFSQANTRLAAVFSLARSRGLKLIVNRPLAMGELPATREAFEFVRAQGFTGVVLTGTKSLAHLIENHTAFYASAR